MGAKELNPVPIMCQLTKLQIEHLVQYVSDSLPIRLDELSDIDEVMFSGMVRLCIDFDVDGLGNIVISEAEIQNKDWDVLYTDSFALAHYLTPVVDTFNQYRKKTIEANKELQNDRIHYRYE